MKTYKQVEGMLYKHFERVSKIERLESKLIRTNLRIENINSRIKRCRFNLDDTMKAITYDKEKITTTRDNTSSIEKALIRASEDLERELKNEIDSRRNIENKIVRLKKACDDVEILIEELTEREREIVRYIYKEKKTQTQIAILMLSEQSGISREKKKIIEKLQKA